MNVKTTINTKSLLPKEEMLEVKPGFKSLEIGIPKESSFQENRVSLTPESVGVLVANGHFVIIEKDAGLSANFSDDEYISKGAQIASSKSEVFKANYILKIEPPTEDELLLMSDSQVLISALQMNTRSVNFFETLNKKRLTSLAFEFIKDQHNKLPFVRIMSEIAGNTSMLIAGEYLSTANKDLLLFLPKHFFLTGANLFSNSIIFFTFK